MVEAEILKNSAKFPLCLKNSQFSTGRKSVCSHSRYTAILHQVDVPTSTALRYYRSTTGTVDVLNCVYRRKLLLNWNRYLEIRHAMRRFVTFRTWSTWSRWSRRLWGCTRVWTCSVGSLLKILQSVSETFQHMDLQDSCLYLWRSVYVRDVYHATDNCGMNLY